MKLRMKEQGEEASRGLLGRTFIDVASGRNKEQIKASPKQAISKIQAPMKHSLTTSKPPPPFTRPRSDPTGRNGVTLSRLALNHNSTALGLPNSPQSPPHPSACTRWSKPPPVPSH